MLQTEGGKGFKKKERGYPMQRLDTKGQAHMMFLHRDNHMQNKGYIQSGTLKILRSKKRDERG